MAARAHFASRRVLGENEVARSFRVAGKAGLHERRIHNLRGRLGHAPTGSSYVGKWLAFSWGYLGRAQQAAPLRRNGNGFAGRQVHGNVPATFSLVDQSTVNLPQWIWRRRLEANGAAESKE